MSFEQSQQNHFDLEVVLKDNALLVLTVRDTKSLKKFSNAYDAANMASKGLTQPLDKFTKILKTAAKHNKNNWSLKYGYFTATKSSKKKEDLIPSYLSKSNVAMLRNKQKRDDMLFVILEINEDFFSIDAQFKLYEIIKPKSPSKRARRKTSSVSKMSFSLEYDTQQKMADMEAKIKSLTRDNQVLKSKITKLESTSGKKQKKMDNEREMRLQANKEKFWLKQKLDRLQKAIAARLKLLGVDFSGVNDITSALDMAFNVIQQLAKELQNREEAFEDMKITMVKAVDESVSYRGNMDKLAATAEKQKNVIKDLKKQLGDKDKRLSTVSHEKTDSEFVFTKQLKEVQNLTNELRNDKERIFDELVDLKAKYKRDIEDKMSEMENMKSKLSKSKEENKTLANENEQIKEELDSYLNLNNNLNAKLEEGIKEIDDLKNELEQEKNKNVDVIEKNKKSKKEIQGLLLDLANLKKLLQKALDLEAQLKNVMINSNDLLQNIASEKKEKQLLQLTNVEDEYD